MIVRRAVHIRFGYAGFVGGNGSIATPYKVSPRKAEMMFLAISVAARTCASTVDAPRCGVAMTRSCASNFLKTVSSPIGSGLEQRQFTCAKKHARPALILVERGMQGHEIGTLEHLFLAMECHPDLLRPPGRDKGITGDDPHVECLRPLCHRFPDLSQTDNAEDL